MEIRQFDNGTASASGRLVSGFAVRFDEVSQPIGGKFREVVAKGAIDEEMLTRCKIEARLNHKQDQVLASNQDGTLQLELRDEGLFYMFESPENEYGNALVEDIKAGKINTSSFAFTVGEAKEYSSAGEDFRTITKIAELFDVAPVYAAAYTTTSCEVRSEEQPKEEAPNEQPKEEEKVEEQPIEKEEINNTKTQLRTMSKHNFSLLKAIKNRANGYNMNVADQEYFKAGLEEFRSAGINAGGDFQLPTNIEERTISVAGEGEDVVETNLMNIIEPLRAKNVLVQSGAKFYTGLVGDVQIPIMSAGNVAWAGETAAATTGDPSFTAVTMSPKRLTCYVDISKQMLVQDSIGVEEAIRQDIVNAINSKLEATILGTESGNTTQPAGMFYGASVVTGCSAMTDFAAIEEAVESANVFGDKKYVANPKVKAALRTLAKGANISQSLYQNGELDGTPMLVTTHVPSKKFIYGDWSNLAIGQWGGIDVTVDNYTQAVNGCVRLVINAYFDAKVLRPSAFQYGEVK